MAAERLSTPRLLAILLGFNLAAAGIAAALGLLAGDAERYFGEHGAVTFLSFAQLLLVAVAALRVYTLRSPASDGRTGWRSSPAVWLLVALGFAFLALDELTLIHEGMDHRIHELFGLTATPLTDRIDDAIVVVYGAVGIAVLFAYRGEMKRYAASLPYAAGGFAALLTMVALDVVSHRADIFSDASLLRLLGAAEDVFKLVGECFFIAAAWCCLGVAGALRGRGAETPLRGT